MRAKGTVSLCPNSAEFRESVCILLPRRVEDPDPDPTLTKKPAPDPTIQKNQNRIRPNIFVVAVVGKFKI